MIVYVESNFPLELARQQEQFQDAEQLLQLAEARQIHLRFPELSLGEPFGALDRYANARNRFLADMERQLSDLNRSQPHQPLVADLHTLVSTLVRLRRDETDRLEATVERMLACGKSLSLTLDLFRQARLAEQNLDLSPQDAIVLTCVLNDLRSIPQPRMNSCFISRNSRDFAAARNDLLALNCRYIAKFADAVAFIRNQIQPNK